MNKELVLWLSKKTIVFATIIAVINCVLFVMFHDDFYFNSGSYFVFTLGTLAYYSFNTIMDVKFVYRAQLIPQYGRKKIFISQLIVLLLTYCVALFPLLLLVFFSFIFSYKSALLDHLDINKVHVFISIIYNSLSYVLIGATSVFWLPQLNSWLRIVLFIWFAILFHNLFFSYYKTGFSEIFELLSPALLILLFFALVSEAKHGEIQ